MEPPQLPSSRAAPSPLEVGQLLLQQEHVGFELIPLLKDLLKLLPTEAALPYVGGAPRLLRGICLQRDRFDQRSTSCGASLPLGITRVLQGVTGRETWEVRVLQQMKDQCFESGMEAGWVGTLVCHLLTSRRFVTQHVRPFPSVHQVPYAVSSGMGP